MAGSPRKGVPQIPSLTGEDNYEDWLSGLEDHLEHYGLQALVFEDDFHHGQRRVRNEMQCLRENKLLVLGAIQLSVAPVSSYLEDAGWDFTKIDQHPRDLFKLIDRTFRPIDPEEVRTTARCVRQLNAKPGGMLLSQFKVTIVVAKQTLVDEGAKISDTLAVSLVLDALEVEYPDWYRSLLRERDTSGLSWKRLLKRMDEKAHQEEGGLDEWDT